MARWIAMSGAAVLLMAGACGCSSSSGLRDTPTEGSTGIWSDPGPFEVTRVRVYPLTRLDEGEGGEPQIVLFLEMTDRWGDTVKAVGDLTVSVWPSRSVGAGGEVEVWEVSLWDAEANAGYYDPTSRTYRIPLTGLPGWVTEEGGPTRDARVELEAVFRTPAKKGLQRTLRDTISIEKPG